MVIDGKVCFYSRITLLGEDATQTTTIRPKHNPANTRPQASQFDPIINPERKPNHHRKTDQLFVLRVLRMKTRLPASSTLPKAVSAKVPTEKERIKGKEARRREIEECKGVVYINACQHKMQNVRIPSFMQCKPPSYTHVASLVATEHIVPPLSNFSQSSTPRIHTHSFTLAPLNPLFLIDITPYALEVESQ